MLLLYFPLGTRRCCDVYSMSDQRRVPSGLFIVGGPEIKDKTVTLVGQVI